jgi:hypothetical protein
VHGQSGRIERRAKVLYTTLKQQCKELLEAKRYDELQVLISAEREKVAAEINQAFPYVPTYLPRFLIGLYGKLLSVIWVFAKNRPSFLRQDANLANQNRRINLIIEMEQKLLEALNQEARVLTAAAWMLERGQGQK